MFSDSLGSPELDAEDARLEEGFLAEIAKGIYEGVDIIEASDDYNSKYASPEYLKAFAQYRKDLAEYHKRMEAMAEET